MELFDRFKQLLSGKRQAIEKDLADPLYGEGVSNLHSFGGKPGIAEEDKLERVKQLTPREYELYLLLLEGFTLKESAKQMAVKYSTANTHMSGIYRKLGVKSRMELIINYRYMTDVNIRNPDYGK